MIYADHNATTPCDPEVASLVLSCLTDNYGNPSSRTSPLGRRARGSVDTAREQLATAIHARPDELVFTSGATEACNMGLLGIVERQLPQRPRILCAATEHPAVLEPLRACTAAGALLEILPVDASGRVDPEFLADHLDDTVGLVAIMLANNETGVIQDIPALSLPIHRAGALLFSDTTQTLGKLDVDVTELGADFCCFSAHKCYGPKGVGALWKRRGLAISPLIRGGGQESGLRSGTENVPGIAGFGLAVERFATNPDLHSHLLRLTDMLESRMRAQLPDVIIHSADAERIPGTSMFSHPGLPASWIAQLTQITVSAGSSCASSIGRSSHVLTAMGIDETVASRSVRISFGKGNTLEEAEAVADALITTAKRLLNGAVPNVSG